MFDPRVYRAGFLPALAAIVALMFSLEPAPEPLEEQAAIAGDFQGRAAARQARSIAALAPVRTPGSNGDLAAADLVRERFEAVPGGEVAVQESRSSFEGDDVTLRNVVLTLPGESEEVLLLVAGRDSPEGPGATTSAAATATLLELADELGASRHRRTLVLASTSSAPDGVRALVEALPAPAGIGAAIVISQPGVPEPEPPFVVPGHAGPESTSAGLIATADEIASVQFEQPTEAPGAWSGLARLAIPVGIGEAAALADAGQEAISISAAGERPPDSDRDLAAAVSAETMLASGNSALGTLLTLDQAAAAPAPGPGAYVRVGGNLLPGWTLTLLAFTLLLPSLLAAADLWLRDRRRSPRAARRSIPWVLERALVPLSALLLLLALAAIGLLPSPGFPYDPGLFPPDVEGPVALVATALALTLTTLLVRPLRTPLDAEPQTLAAAAGLLCCLAVLGIWLLNPYLALLLVPAAHVWLLPARAQGPPKPLTIAIVAALAMLPALAAAVAVASDLALGPAAPWHLLLLLLGGQPGLPTGLLICALFGGLIACVAAAGAGVRLEPRGAPSTVRGPAGYAGPGSLGGTPSSLPKA